MKKIISMLLCCAMLGALCACQHGGDFEKRTPVPQFDMTASYSFDDVELKNDDGVSYYRQSLGSAEISSKDERAAQRINASLAELYVRFRADAEYTRRVAEDQHEGETIELSYRCTPTSRASAAASMPIPASSSRLQTLRETRSSSRPL